MTKPVIVSCSRTGCGKRFTSTSALNMHMAAVHRSAAPQSQPERKPGWLKRLWRWIFGQPKKS